jgi:hypothetical protein
MSEKQQLDPDLADKLRAGAEVRVQAQIQAARQRVAKQAETRAEFNRRRRYGVERRNAAREARLNLIKHHSG